MAKYHILEDKKEPSDFSREEVRKRRTFPGWATVLLIVLIAAQIGLLMVIIFYQPSPQDRILDYRVTVEPMEDGTLNMLYEFEWEALDPSEDLTWIEIGVANQNFWIDPKSLSPTVSDAYRDVDDGYCYVHIDLRESYGEGDVLNFSFRIIQYNLLCENNGVSGYEWVPGWFNATPVDHYLFRWKSSDEIQSHNADALRDGYLCWEGKMDCGTYVPVSVHYSDDAFPGATRVGYHRFDGDVSNELMSEKIAVSVFLGIIILVILIGEVILTDSLVSYHRGCGFLHCYGYHVHLYGRTNPLYKKEAERRAAASSSHGGGHGGGCACACACACAGGGRAGCSQKDTYASPAEHREDSVS